MTQASTLELLSGIDKVAAAADVAALVANDCATLLPLHEKLECLLSKRAEPAPQAAAAPDPEPPSCAETTDPFAASTVETICTAVQFVYCTDAFVDAATAAAAIDSHVDLLGAALRILIAESLQGWLTQNTISASGGADSSEEPSFGVSLKRSVLRQAFPILLQNRASLTMRTDLLKRCMCQLGCSTIDHHFIVQALVSTLLLQPDSDPHELHQRYFKHRKQAAMLPSKGGATEENFSVASCVQTLSDLAKMLTATEQTQKRIFLSSAYHDLKELEASFELPSVPEMPLLCCTMTDMVPSYLGLSGAEKGLRWPGVSLLLSTFQDASGDKLRVESALMEQMISAVRDATSTSLRREYSELDLMSLLGALASRTGECGLSEEAHHMIGRWEQVFRPVLSSLVQDKLDAAVAAKPLETVVRHLMQFPLASGKDTSEALDNLSWVQVLVWRGQESPTSIPSWKLQPAIHRAVCDTFGLVVQVAQMHYDLLDKVMLQAQCNDQGPSAAVHAYVRRFGNQCLYQLLQLAETTVTKGDFSRENGYGDMACVYSQVLPMLSQQWLQFTVRSGGGHPIVVRDLALLRDRITAVQQAATLFWSRQLCDQCMGMITTQFGKDPSVKIRSERVSARLFWQDVPLDYSSASMLLPQRPSEEWVQFLWKVVKQIRRAGVASISTRDLATFSQEFCSVCASRLERNTIDTSAVTPDEQADSNTQRYFDSLFLADSFAVDGTGAMRSRQDQLKRETQQADPVNFTLSERPLRQAAAASAKSMSTLFAPFGGVAVSVQQPKTPTSAATLPVGTRSASLLQLPPPCARFLYLPVQTTALQSRHSVHGTLGVTSEGSATAKPSESLLSDVLEGSGATASLMAKMGQLRSDARGVLGGVLGGVLSSTKRTW